MFLELVLLSICLGAILYWRYWAKAYYWASMGVRQPKQNTFFFGNDTVTCWDVIRKKRHFHDVSLELYRNVAHHLLKVFCGPI
jgi:hypothetical protein